jgi:hypothetical protein
MVIVLLANLFLVRGSRFYAFTLLAQGIAYGLAALGLLGLTPRCWSGSSCTTARRRARPGPAPSAPRPPEEK